MCTSLIHNGKKTIVGWNLDILDMEYKVVVEENRVYIAINDRTEGWLPLFGANAKGDFVGMPTCYPHDSRSNPINKESQNIIMLDIDLLLGKKSLQEIKEIVENNRIYSVPGVTFQSQLTDEEGNVLQIVPGQGYRYLEKPKFSVMTNFSPLKGYEETHPWMGRDRYEKAVSMLEAANDEFDVSDCFEILKATAQMVCPTVVSMVFDVTNSVVYWCENREWEQVHRTEILIGGYA